MFLGGPNLKKPTVSTPDTKTRREEGRAKEVMQSIVVLSQLPDALLVHPADELYIPSEQYYVRNVIFLRHVT